MPRRTNLFQEVVAIIFGHLAGEASKQESAWLVNRLTGMEREVDVVLRTTIAGVETVIGVEAVGRSRRATVEWVEQMIGKHRNLPTTNVVLVAEAGFSKQARALARAENLVPLAPEDIGDDPATAVLHALPALWPKSVSLTPTGARVWVHQPDAGLVWFNAPADLDLVLADGESGYDLLTFFRETYNANWPQIAEQIGLADLTEDMESDATLQLGPPIGVGIDGESHELFARWQEGDTQELHRVEKVVLQGRALIHVSEAQLTHKQLGELDVRYAYGEGTVAGKPALFVVTEHEQEERFTVRMADRDAQRPRRG